MKKKFFCLILMLAFCLSFLPLSAAADGDGTYNTYKPYEDASYELKYSENEDGTLTITGYTGTAEGRLVLPEKINGKAVTAIGSKAFQGRRGLTGDLVIPDNVTNIGDYAFSFCHGFTGNLILGQSVTTIGKEAFYECDGFTGELVIPDNVTNIGDHAFYYCHGFTGGLVIPDNVTTIGSSAFRCCSGLTGDLIIPDSVTEIGEGVFFNCKSFTGTLHIPDGWTEIKAETFLGCGFTGKLCIPDSVTVIGEDAFAGCNFTGDLVIPDNVTTIGDRAFMDCYFFTGDLIIPNSVTSIGFFAFESCEGFTGDLIIPDSVSSIGGSAFSGCKGFTGTLHLPASLTEIQREAFSGCGFTGSITIPAGVTSIVENPFVNSKNLTAIIVDADNQNYVSQNGMLFSKDKTKFIACPAGKEGTLNIPETISEIGSYAFYGCSGFTGNLIIPDSVTVIGDGAFEHCSGFTGGLKFGEAVTTIGGDAFFYCDGFTGSLTIPDSVTEIGGGAFEHCSGISSVIIPESLTTINRETFEGCKNIHWISLPLSVTEIYYKAFYGCPKLTDVYYAGTEEDRSQISISSNGNYNKSLLNAEWHCGVTLLGFCGKDDENSLVYALIEDGETCELCISGSGAMADYGDGKLPPWHGKIADIKTLVIEDTVTEIGAHAFEGCGALTSVTIPSCVNEIHASAFAGCAALATVDYKSTEDRKNHIAIGTGNEALQNVVWSCKLASGFCGAEGDGSNLKWELSENGELRIYGRGRMADYGWHGDAPWFPFRDDLKTLKLEPGMTSIGNDAFNFSEDWWSDDGFTGTLTLPDSLVTIGSLAFSGCSGFSGNLIIPEGVTKIEDCAFQDCDGFTGALRLPSGLTSLGSWAFNYCSFKGPVIIPAGVTDYGHEYENPFPHCYNLTEIIVKEGNQYFASQDGLLLTKDMTKLIACPAGKTGALNIPESVTEIGDYACSRCDKLTGNLEIPEGVTEIGECAFSHCQGFTGILRLPGSLVDLGYNAFWNCSFEGSVTIPASVTQMGESNPFNGCHKLTEIIVEDGNQNYVSKNGLLLTKDMTKFIACPAGKSGKLDIPETVTEIGDDACSDCFNLTGNLVIPGGVTDIGYSAFEGCSGFTGNLIIPGGVTDIGGSAFEGCSGLSSVSLPAGVTVIRFCAFNGCSLLKDVYYDGTETMKNAIDIDDGNEVLQSAVWHYGQQTAIVRPGAETIIDSSYSLITEKDPEGCEGNIKVGEEEHSEFELYDIHYEDAEQNEVEVNGTFTVKLPIPQSYNKEKCVVLRQESDGSWTTLESRLEGNFIVFETTHFSFYALVDTSAEDFQPGDVNKDGHVTADDMQRIYEHLNGSNPFSEADLAKADVNGDGYITADDMQRIYEHLNGSNPLF